MRLLVLRGNGRVRKLAPPVAGTGPRKDPRLTGVPEPTAALTWATVDGDPTGAKSERKAVIGFCAP